LGSHSGRRGRAVGPDLAGAGSKASRENLLESILYPSRAISFGFDNWVIEKTDGVQIIGLIVEDRPRYVVLRDANARTTRSRPATSTAASRARSR
jgi:putative heme-binding domain-containing protein